jgi:hypothetical protein
MRYNGRTLQVIYSRGGVESGDWYVIIDTERENFTGIYLHKDMPESMRSKIAKEDIIGLTREV